MTDVAQLPEAFTRLSGLSCARDYVRDGRNCQLGSANGSGQDGCRLQKAIEIARPAKLISNQF
jgi:hypothetical protein